MAGLGSKTGAQKGMKKTQSFITYFIEGELLIKLFSYILGKYMKQAFILFWWLALAL